MEANVWRWPNAAHLGPHLDMRQKLATHIFYLNAGWNSWWGGCLRILNYAEACGGLLRQISARQPIAARG